MYYGKANPDHEMYAQDMPQYSYASRLYDSDHADDHHDNIPTTTIGMVRRSRSNTPSKLDLEEQELYKERLACRHQKLRAKARADSGGKRYCFGRLDKNGYRSCLLISCTSIVATVALLLTFFFGPRLAQGLLDDGMVSVESVAVNGTNITTCAGSTVSACLGATIVFSVDNPTLLEVKLDEFTVNLYYNEARFASIRMPVMSLGSGHTSINETVFIVVTNKTAFTRFGSAIITEPSSVVAVRASDIGGRSWWVPLAGLELKRDIQIEGFNNFRDYQPRIFDMQFVPAQSTIEQAVYLSKFKFFNPTNFTIWDMGRFLASLNSNDEEVGAILSVGSLGIKLRKNTEFATATWFTLGGATAQFSKALAKNLEDGKDMTVTLKGFGSTNPVWADMMQSINVPMLIAAR